MVALAAVTLSISVPDTLGTGASALPADQGLIALLRLPVAAQGPVSATLGRESAAYRITGLTATNPAQRLSGRFGIAGIVVNSGTARFSLGLVGIGRGQATGLAGSVAPVARDGSVVYARAGIRESWTNGPLGLEQTFVVTDRPAGTGALTLSVRVPTGARLVGQAVRLPGGLSYTGLRATDASGRVLRSWIQLQRGRALLRVDDANAKYPVTVDPYVQQAEITEPGNSTNEDELGYSIAISGSTIVVGAPRANNTSGAAYVFQQGKSGSWTEEAELTPSDPDTNAAEFGYAVAISGNTIVVGTAPAPGETYSLLPPESVYIYEAQNGVWHSGTETTKLTAASAGLGDGQAPSFGASVAINGSTLVVGAPNWQAAYEDPTGAAFVYTLNSSGAVASGPVQLTAGSQTLAGNTSFGYAVATSGDTIVVGDPGGNEPGSAYIYSEPSSGWATTSTPSYSLTANDTGSIDEFGYAVAIDGSTAVVAAPKHSGSNPGSEQQEGALYVFSQQGNGSWPTTQSAELNPSDSKDVNDTTLGTDGVAISGSTIVGGTGEGTGSLNRAAAYVFSEPSGGWSGQLTQAPTLLPTGTVPADVAGESATIDSVGISGTTVVIGSDAGAGYGSGQVFVFGPHAATTTVGTASVAGATVSGDSVSAKATCTGTANESCALSYVLTSRETIEKGKPVAVAAGETVKKTTKTVTIGSARATLARGGSKTVKLGLNGTGKTLLAKFLTLPAYLTVSEAQTTGAATVIATKRVTFHASKAKEKKH